MTPYDARDMMPEKGTPMPPLPPARRQDARPAPPTPKAISTRHQRFLRLLSSGRQEPPSTGLSQAAWDALPERCRLALARVATDERIDPWTRRALEAYYASGYRPINPTSTTWGAWDYTEDAKRATRLMQAPHGDMSVLLSYNPATSDKSIEMRLLALLDNPEPKAADKVRLEAVRLLLDLKGHLRDEKGQAIQATQIIIHTSQEPTVQPAEQPNLIKINL